MPLEEGDHKVDAVALRMVALPVVATRHGFEHVHRVRCGDYAAIIGTRPERRVQRPRGGPRHAVRVLSAEDECGHA